MKASLAFVLLMVTLAACAADKAFPENPANADEIAIAQVPDVAANEFELMKSKKDNKEEQKLRKQFPATEWRPVKGAEQFLRVRWRRLGTGHEKLTSWNGFYLEFENISKAHVRWWFKIKTDQPRENGQAILVNLDAGESSNCYQIGLSLKNIVETGKAILVMGNRDD